jgi:RecB family exonuclease
MQEHEYVLLLPLLNKNRPFSEAALIPLLNALIEKQIQVSTTKKSWDFTISAFDNNMAFLENNKNCLLTYVRSVYSVDQECIKR